MYRVLFAEDELLIRLGMQNSIPWETYQMELVAQADNGLDAYRLFREVHPDIVITDIRMDGMDGVQLIRKIRETDNECAIIVLSCLDDFEILRKMIPYNLIGYILKASMTMEEVYGVLQKTVDYLKGIGRDGSEPEKAEKSREERLADCLLGRAETAERPGEIFPDGSAPGELLLFRLGEEDRDKINSLAMKFVYDLVNRQAPEGLAAETGDREFCLLLPAGAKGAENIEENINHSVEGFLGVRFLVRHGFCRKEEALSELYRRLLDEPVDEEPPEGRKDQIIQDALKVMKERYREPLSLTDISSTLGISSSYFSYLFKKKTGKNYVEYLNEIRLSAVKEELKNTDVKISAIAEQNGFRNFEYFSRFFKKATGLSPARWRQQNQ